MGSSSQVFKQEQHLLGARDTGEILLGEDRIRHLERCRRGSEGDKGKERFLGGHGEMLLKET